MSLSFSCSNEIKSQRWWLIWSRVVLVCSIAGLNFPNYERKGNEIFNIYYGSGAGSEFYILFHPMLHIILIMGSS